MKRADKMKKHSDSSLVAFVKSGSLSAAAAAYELRSRNRAVPAIGSAQPNYDSVHRKLSIFQSGMS